MPTKSLFTIAVSPDEKLLAVAGFENDAFLWDLPHLKTPSESPPEEKTNFELAWDALNSKPTPPAYTAIRQFAYGGEAAAAFIAQRLQAAPELDSAQLARLMIDLDDGDFEIRQQAEVALLKMGIAAEDAIRTTLEGGCTAEVRETLQRVLGSLGSPAAEGEVLRSVRAIQALEWNGTNKAREVLEVLSKGAHGARQTGDAKAAWFRLQQKSAQK